MPQRNILKIEEEKTDTIVHILKEERKKKGGAKLGITVMRKKGSTKFYFTMIFFKIILYLHNLYQSVTFY